MSRSTWACELKCNASVISFFSVFVTLHVSVWVEISYRLMYASRKLSRSTWACELKYIHGSCGHTSPWSRSTWACELKFRHTGLQPRRYSHAPRERVSWNLKIEWERVQTKKSRSTWACELKFKNMENSIDKRRSRSTWACELKLSKLINELKQMPVTLHVSVWVEIPEWTNIYKLNSSRSTWACELKYLNISVHNRKQLSRSTWACELKSIDLWLSFSIVGSRSTWACELK